MFSKGIIFLMIFFVVLLQTSVFTNLFFWGVGVNLILILIISWTVNEGFENALAKIILAGFMLDLFSFYPVGTNILIFTLVAFFVSSFSKRFLVVAKSWRVAILFFLIIFSTILYEVCVQIIFKMNLRFSVILLIREIMVNVLFFVLCNYPITKIEQFLNLSKNRKNLNYV